MSRDHDRDGHYRDRNKMEYPPHSRLFIVCHKSMTESTIRDVFSKFGTIEDVQIVKDRATGEAKGLCYVQFLKTSQAAIALEELNCRCIDDTGKKLRILVAYKRDSANKMQSNEDITPDRLFIVVPKKLTENEIHEQFKRYGEIESVLVVKNKDTHENKGFAYVKYFKFSHAARAFEEADKAYKAVFAEPRRRNMQSSDDFSKNNFGGYQGRGEPRGRGQSALMLLDMIPTRGLDGYTNLRVIASPQTTQDQLWKLFDIIPGLDYLELHSISQTMGPPGQATAVYKTPHAAAYAREKLHGFEYPPGCRLIVRPENTNRPCVGNNSQQGGENNNKDLQYLAETIATATKLITAAGLTPEALMSSSGGNNFCSVSLPPAQPMMPVDTPCAARCFIVFSPNPPPSAVLRDAFCRFGSLIDVYALPKKNCGYAKYGESNSAVQAIRTLHGADLCGIRLKVIEAEERDGRRKRPRYHESEDD